MEKERTKRDSETTGSGKFALIATDEPNSRRELEVALQGVGYETDCIEDGREVSDVLRKLPSVDILVLDEMLPGMRGHEIAERLKKENRLVSTVKVLLAPETDPGLVRRAMSSGIDDCLAKPFQPEMLQLRLAVWMKLSELARKVESVSSHDQITNLYSHGLILEAAQHELDRAAREATPLSILLIDIDHLREINDQYGHQMGDKVLKEAAERTRIALRSYDLTGRYGGEEFLTVLPRCGRANAIEVGERVRRAVAAEPFAIDSIKLRVTVSIGVATTMGDERVPSRRIIRAADHALYKAKREGRDRVEIAVSLKTWAGQSN